MRYAVQSLYQTPPRYIFGECLQDFKGALDAISDKYYRKLISDWPITRYIYYSLTK